MKVILPVGAQNYKTDANLLKRKAFARYCRPEIDLIKEMVRLLKLQGNEKILDVGCGNGDALIQIRKKYGHRGPLYGLDISEGMIKKAKLSNKQEGANIKFTRQDAKKISFPDNSFDVVVLKHVLHNIADYPKALKECHRILKKEGRLVITINSKKNKLLLRKLKPKISRLLNGFSIDSDYCLNLENVNKDLESIFRKVKKVKFESKIYLKKTKPYLDHLDSGRDFWRTDDQAWKKVLDFCKKYFDKIIEREGGIRDFATVGIVVAKK